MSEFIKELLEKSKRGYTSRFIRIIKDEEKEIKYKMKKKLTISL